jgi:hypothetical protein
VAKVWPKALLQNADLAVELLMRLLQFAFPVLAIFASSATVSQTFTGSLNDDLYVSGTVLGIVLLEGFDERNATHSEQTDAMVQFFQDGSAEYDFRSLDGSSKSCSGRLEFIEAVEDSSWQTVEFRITPQESIGEACPEGGFLIFSRRLDANISDPVRIGYRPYAIENSGPMISGGVYFTDGVPLLQDYPVLNAAKAELANVMEEAALRSGPISVLDRAAAA